MYIITVVLLKRSILIYSYSLDSLGRWNYESHTVRRLAISANHCMYKIPE